MARIFESILYVIASATHKELARQVRYLKVENEVLRSKLPDRITVTQSERERLLKVGEKLGKAIHQLVTIVAPGTFLRWIREAKVHRKKGPSRKRGRPMTALAVRRLVLKLARENAWGYGRIWGELSKLGIKLSESSIKRILKKADLPTGPIRGEGTWDQFLKRHASSLWQMDFFSQKVLTLTGIREVFVIAFLHVHTRRAIVSPATEHPNEAWVEAQAESFVKQARKSGLAVRYIIHDRDTKFTRGMKQTLRRKRVKTVRIAFRATRMNAYIERFIRTLRNEVLDHFLIFGGKHMDSLLKTFLGYYHRSRPHQGKENQLLVKPKAKRRRKVKPPNTISLGDVRCEQKLGGLLKAYKWAA